jgi:hypothetical protein
MSSLLITLSRQWNAKGLAALCRALSTNETLMTLGIQLCERGDATDFVPVQMKRTIEEVAVMLSHNSSLKSIRIRREEYRQRLGLVRPLTDAGLQLDVDVTKLNLILTARESGLSAEVYGLVLQEVLQNPTLKELTVENSRGSYKDMMSCHRSCGLAYALVRLLSGDADGQQANVTLTKLNLALEINPDDVTSIFVEFLPEILWRNSTLKELIMV